MDFVMHACVNSLAPLNPRVLVSMPSFCIAAGVISVQMSGRWSVYGLWLAGTVVSMPVMSLVELRSRTESFGTSAGTDTDADVDGPDDADELDAAAG
ncbi:hypothetical protein ASG12_06130 [Williamsia sp. Leaf354]|nr:hypothetical protein ASG12_06130 [Williamsia sp. Leaf354]